MSYEIYENIKTHFSNLDIPVNPVTMQTPADVSQFDKKSAIILSMGTIEPRQNIANAQEMLVPMRFYFCSSEYEKTSGDIVPAGKLASQLNLFIINECFLNCQSWGAENSELRGGELVIDGAEYPNIAEGYVDIYFYLCSDINNITFDPEAL